VSPFQNKKSIEISKKGNKEKVINHAKIKNVKKIKSVRNISIIRKSNFHTHGVNASEWWSKNTHNMVKNVVNSSHKLFPKLAYFKLIVQI